MRLNDIDNKFNSHFLMIFQGEIKRVQGLRFKNKFIYVRADCLKISSKSIEAIEESLWRQSIQFNHCKCLFEWHFDEPDFQILKIHFKNKIKVYSSNNFIYIKSLLDGKVPYYNFISDFKIINEIERHHEYAINNCIALDGKVKQVKICFNIHKNPKLIQELEILKHLKLNQTQELMFQNLDSYYVQEATLILVMTQYKEEVTIQNRMIFRKMIRCVLELHKIGIAHQKLTRQNFIVDKSGCVILINFQNARFLSNPFNSQDDLSTTQQISPSTRSHPITIQQQDLRDLSQIIKDMISDDLIYTQIQREFIQLVSQDLEKSLQHQYLMKRRNPSEIILELDAKHLQTPFRS
ncbi:serine/threonine protein kinase [Paramecium bursaria]